jgi:hypothetical protein
LAGLTLHRASIASPARKPVKRTRRETRK